MTNELFRYKKEKYYEFLFFWQTHLFNQVLSRSISLPGVLETFFRQVYSPLRYQQISQTPFLLHVHPILCFFFSTHSLIGWIPQDLLASNSIYFLRTIFLVLSSHLLLTFFWYFRFLPFFLVHVIIGRSVAYNLIIIYN